MLEFCGPNDGPAAHERAYHRQSGDLRARTYFELQGLFTAINSVLQDDSEGVTAEYGRLAYFE